jgi:streptomycin 6-kinase
MNVRYEMKKYLQARLIMDEPMPTHKRSAEEVAGICARKWSLKDLSLEGETSHSHFYSCNSKQYGPALLKILSQDGLRLEAGGFEVLSQYAEQDVVRIFAFDQTSALMEVLEGPRLLDVIDDGQADVALEAQLDLTDRLLEAKVTIPGLKNLETMMSDCLAMGEDSVPNWAMDVIPQAQRICHKVLNSKDEWVALHGDLHPRNIIMHKGSWRAIDARGIFGPRAFEYANAFINPWDRKTLIFEEGRMERLVDSIGNRLGCSNDKVVGCAIANALYYAQISFQFGQGRHPIMCIRKLIEFMH